MITIVVTEQTDNPQEVSQAVQKADLIIYVNSLSEFAQAGHIHVREDFTLRPDHAQTIADAILMAVDTE